MSSYICLRWGLNQNQRQGPTLVHSQVTGIELQVTAGGFWGGRMCPSLRLVAKEDQELR